MNYEWNLDPIYHGFDDPQYDADMETLRRQVERLTLLAGKLPGMDPRQGLREGLTILEAIEQPAQKLALYAELRQSTDTKNPEASSKMGQIMTFYSAAAAPRAAFQAWAASLDIPAVTKDDDMLRDYTFLLTKMQEKSKYLLSGDGEAVAARFSISGGSAWAELQQYLTSTVRVSYRGTVTNLSAIRNMAYDPDPQVRKDAYEAELACYGAIADPVAYALNSIKMETISDCALRGYPSPLDRTLQHADMKRETLDAMLGAIEEYLPKFRQYLKAKAAALGHKNGLPWYDLFAPMGSSTTTFTPEQARDYLVTLFSHFDGDLSRMIADAFDNGWIDFFPRDGKAGGAFCAGVPSLKESRILTNFDGKLTDVVTLAHELGHAFHNQCILSHRPLNQDYSMPLAETASTFNECVVMASAIRSAADDAERLNLVESQLQDTTQIICDILSRYLFETAVFASRESRFLDAGTLCDRMLTAQKQSYGDGLDPQYLHPYMWLCKSHYYGSTFYNFPYAFGGLFARGLYAQYLAEGEAFIPKYKKLLYTTTVATAEDTAKVAGIDLTDKAFWRGALQTVADQIDLFCGLVKKEEN